MARKLRPGIHTVTIRGKQRKVQVLANGKWKFLKGGSSPRSGARPKRASSQSKRVGRRRVRRTRPMAKRGRARRYYRRVKRAVRRFGMPSLAGLGLGLYAMNNFGVFAALDKMKSGDIMGAAGEITSRATNLNTYVGPVLGTVALGMVRQMVPSRPICKFGRFGIRVF